MIESVISKVTGYVRSTAEGYARDAAYPVPAFRLTVDGLDIAYMVSPRLMSLDLTDNRGVEADQLTITLSDHDGLLTIPPKGAVLRLWLGWSDTGLVDKGTYTVDETEHSGAPDVLSIRARSADLRKGLKTKRERSWSNTTLGEVLGDIAIGNNLTATIAGALDGLPILQLDQANESDANLISRLGEEFDAVASVKAGCLLCLPAGGGKTASGLDLPHITLTRIDGDQHRYLQADRDSYDGVRAYYYDVNSAKKQEAIAGGGDNLKDLRHTYSDQQSALRAARAEFRRLQRGSATLSYTLAMGRPDLIPELTYTLQGVKAEIDEIIWYGGNVQHSLTADGGYTVSLELESKLPEDNVEDLAEDNAGDYTGIIAYYRDEKSGKEKTITAGDQAKPRRLRWLYASEKTAKRAVDREWRKTQTTAE
ncbi:phage late control D family protein [Pseudomonas lactis]|uniref:phage late control D family protein n=1 Tax=Pseudomonas TaxID=286 RepID=UPI000BB61E2D|nr:phage late control D family protein [Pseudomonas fluorescens]MBA5956211.1 phage late control D family protein [Pseudomonas lactis]PRW80064.1 late control protein [Pseudomonas fluorescens]PRW80839.1 late control protein [Pseudomonas fluorescens]